MVLNQSNPDFTSRRTTRTRRRNIGIGVRIEDDVLVTEDGVNLTQNVRNKPKKSEN